MEEPILPLQLLAHATRNAANASRALLYAGFYGLFYFMAQFLQDVQGYSPLRAGLAFLPMPASVFLASQLSSRVLLRRLPEKAVMILGNAIAIVGLVLATRVGSGSSYAQIVVCLVLIGAGSGMTLVALTSASLADVEPDIAGAASGLVNVSQQLGAAVGLAVLVTAFNSLAGRAQLVPGATSAAAVHALDDVFRVAALLAVGALAIVVFGVRRSPATILVPEESVLERVAGTEEFTRGEETLGRAEVYGEAAGEVGTAAAAIERVTPDSSPSPAVSTGWDRTVPGSPGRSPVRCQREPTGRLSPGSPSRSAQGPGPAAHRKHPGAES